MKKGLIPLLAILPLILRCYSPTAQAQTQTVTLSPGVGTNVVQLAVAPNQIVSLLYGNCPSNGNYCLLYLTNGVYRNPVPIGGLPYGTFDSGTFTLTGVTNIAVLNGGCFTFKITTPASQTYLPANAVVIPTDATGPVQIILESSADLVNWISAMPGTYGTTYSNRFFRVRAVAGN